MFYRIPPYKSEEYISIPNLTDSKRLVQMLRSTKHSTLGHFLLANFFPKKAIIDYNIFGSNYTKHVLDCLWK